MIHHYYLSFIFIYLSLTSLCCQQLLKPKDEEQKIPDSLVPLVRHLTTKSMNNAWIKLQEEFESYIQNLTTRRDELLNKTEELSQLYENHLAGTGHVPRCPVTGQQTFFLYENFCYLFESMPVSWNRAKLNCIQIGAYLARPDTSSKDTFLETHPQRKDTAYWVGATDMDVEGTWRWTDNDEDVNFSNWGANQPNNWGSGQDCLSIGYETGGDRVWNDDDCNMYKPYICEKAVFSG
ncbi:lectin BRA-3-like isoform X2 [Pecten maximus]|uniref:lectin BRA-3-like isoform X2 n=1 Tax=Pecten maximus TaxID=6579 RepID=UPI001457F913|nr:lectin BRA-3-like isoform X2 [Pecten maximus]